MMIGVTSAEAFVLLNSVEMELGLESETRNKLVSDLVTWSPHHHSDVSTHVCQVTASYSHHVKEIFSAVITEYTDWASVARHPVTTRQPNTRTMDTLANCPQ